MTPEAREAFCPVHRDLPRALDHPGLSGALDMRDAALSAALDEARLQIDRWRAAPDQIACALLTVVPQ